MIKKEKMFIISGIVDESIKSQTAIYDITIFNNFVSFEQHISRVPIVIETLVLTSDELYFNNANMMRIFNLLNSPFVRIKGNIIYLVDDSCDVNTINELLANEGKTNWAVYQGTLNLKFISDIVSGNGRESAEGIIDVITIRMREDEYSKQVIEQKYQSDDDTYNTDEIILSGVPDEEEPVDIVPAASAFIEDFYVVGDDSDERTLFTFLLAQYQSLTQRVLLCEKDYEYHRLTEMVTKSSLDVEFIDIQDVIKDISAVLRNIKLSQKKIVFIGARSKVDVNYNFIIEMLEANLNGFIPCVVHECNFSEVPYGRNCTIVMRNNIPDILRSCSQLIEDIDEYRVSFVGLQIGSLGPMNVNSLEMNYVLSSVLDKESLQVSVMQVNGIQLNGEGEVYDLFGVVRCNNRR